MLLPLHLLSKGEALFQVHFPESQELLSKALFRLKLEELFYIQLQLIQKNYLNKKLKGFPFKKVGDYFNTFYHKHLPFPLTNAQKRVIKEIRSDMGTGAQMNRLLQGDASRRPGQRFRHVGGPRGPRPLAVARPRTPPPRPRKQALPRPPGDPHDRQRC